MRPDKSSDDVLAVIATAHAWDAAMITNDVRTIGVYLADDWQIVGPDGRVTDKGEFLAHIESGALMHDVMESDQIDVRVYGEAAVLTATGVSGGAFDGQRFLEHERMSCMFVRHDASWRCVLTHLSRIDGAPQR